MTTSAGTGSEGFYNADGSLQDIKVKALARSYLQYTQGDLNSMSFDINTADFQAVFTLKTKISSPSVLFFSEEYWYQNGITFDLYDVETSNLLVKYTDYWVDETQANFIQFAVTNSAYDGKQVQIKASPLSQTQ